MGRGESRSVAGQLPAAACDKPLRRAPTIPGSAPVFVGHKVVGRQAVAVCRWFSFVESNGTRRVPTTLRLLQFPPPTSPLEGYPMLRLCSAVAIVACCAAFAVAEDKKPMIGHM